MRTKSRIEWTEQTWNPAVGCAKVSPGCTHCYAEVMTRRRQATGVNGRLLEGRTWDGVPEVGAKIGG